VAVHHHVDAGPDRVAHGGDALQSLRIGRALRRLGGVLPDEGIERCELHRGEPVIDGAARGRGEARRHALRHPTVDVGVEHHAPAQPTAQQAPDGHAHLLPR
jgi:hypothetical protein